MESISVFEIIKVGIGPSSSHTMGPWRAASFFLEFLNKEEKIAEVVNITTYLFGSLAKTGWGHGTDVAVLMGLSQEDYMTIDTTTIRQKADHIIQSGQITIDKNKTIGFNYKDHMVFDFDQSLDFHPNGMRFVAQFADGGSVAREYFSVGGGFVVSHASDHVAQHPIVTQYPCHSAQDIEAYCDKMNLSISQLVLMNEMAWRSEAETRAEALNIWNEIKRCIFRGVSKSGILPGGLGVQRRAADMLKKLMPGQSFLSVEDLIKAIQLGSHDFNTVNKWVSTFALAVNEENADFGRIITAPTNGASGVIPAVMMYAYCFTPHFGEEEIIKFILTAGEIGTLYKKGATISAAMGGCQAEIGVSSSMAAGGLTEALGGSRAQVLQAAEIAMEHHLGMTCDPIGGLVQIPCIERNCMGAIKAITASNIAMGLDIPTALVSLDNVIKTMWETALDMNTKYKETSEGGLANISVNISEC